VTGPIERTWPSLKRLRRLRLTWGACGVVPARRTDARRASKAFVAHATRRSRRSAAYSASDASPLPSDAPRPRFRYGPVCVWEAVTEIASAGMPVRFEISCRRDP
jgi:hypothetical protein